MPPKKSNLNNARSKEARRKRVERAHLSAEKIATRNASQRIRTAEGRIKKESQEQYEDFESQVAYCGLEDENSLLKPRGSCHEVPLFTPLQFRTSSLPDVTNENLEDNRCKSCFQLLDSAACRYACVECAWRACGSCEAAAPHLAHAVLRAPPHRTHSEINTILRLVREQIILLQETGQINSCRVKLEPEEEENTDPLQFAETTIPESFSIDIVKNELPLEDQENELNENVDEEDHSRTLSPYLIPQATNTSSGEQLLQNVTSANTPMLVQSTHTFVKRTMTIPPSVKSKVLKPGASLLESRMNLASSELSVATPGPSIVIKPGLSREVSPELNNVSKPGTSRRTYSTVVTKTGTGKVREKVTPARPAPKIDIASDDDATSDMQMKNKGSPAALLPCSPCIFTPGGSRRIERDPVLYYRTEAGQFIPWRPPKAATMASPAGSAPGSSTTLGKQGRKRKAQPAKSTQNPKCRRSLPLNDTILNILNDSGSDDDNNEDVDSLYLRRQTRIIRDTFVRLYDGCIEKSDSDWNESDDESESEDEDEKESEDKRKKFMVRNDERRRINVSVECDRLNIDERMEIMNDNLNVENVATMSERINERMYDDLSVRVDVAPVTADVNSNFLWSADFDSFAGQRESYLRSPGPTFSSQNPLEIFLNIWDLSFMETVCTQTNKYAWEVIAQLSDPSLGGKIPAFLNSWTETTVEELYRYFAVLIYISLCTRSKLIDYWTTGVLGTPALRQIMSRNRFVLLTRFLHFVDNDYLQSTGDERKVGKVVPVLEHLNHRFMDMYVPEQHLSLDESLLLWKGRLSWRQCIRTKAAHFGIKSFELCESMTGYLLKCRLYTGKTTAMNPGPLYGFKDKTTKVVLDLLEGYMDHGHVLVMDNWYNQLPLTRYLKGHRATDVLGTLNRRRIIVPNDIKTLKPNEMTRGDSVSRHCGDISLVAWKDVKLVTVISTYHHPEMVPGSSAGQPVLKPTAVEECNKYMGGVDLKDQKLSMFLLERKRGRKWYMKVFRRLFNTSLQNAFIIYLKNPMYRLYSHREFRLKVASELLDRFPRVSAPRALSTAQLRELSFQPGPHFPDHTELDTGSSKSKHKRLCCVQCSAAKKRTQVTIQCTLCRVPLCLGRCWREYHTNVV